METKQVKFEHLTKQDMIQKRVGREHYIKASSQIQLTIGWFL